MPDGNPRWTVTAQREDWQVVPATGQATQGMLVTFQTASGGTGTVFVPSDQYTAAKVQELIRAKAGEIDAVARLTG